MPHLTRKRVFIIICLLLLYISWGSGYYATKIAINYFPPLILTGLKFMVAGALLLAYTYMRREETKITWNDVKYVLINGIFLVVISSGFVAVAQETVPSGMVAILYGAAPIWLVLGQWLLWGGKKPRTLQVFGLILGFASLLWLNVHQGMHSDASIWGLLLILFSTFSWVYGSHVSQVCHSDHKHSVLRSSGLLLFVGGAESLLLGLAVGESLSLASLSFQAYAAFAYVTLMSTLIGYTTYLWLLFNSRAIVAISYEYVTPVIAIALGALLGGEHVDGVILAASGVLLLSVFCITSPDAK